jgi:hypothetical protein
VSYRLQFWDAIRACWCEHEATYMLKTTAAIGASLKAASVAWVPRWRVVHNQSGSIVLEVSREEKTIELGMSKQEAE